MSVERGSENADGLRWFKSSYSGSGGGNCVEVAVSLDAVLVRDSKTVGGRPVLRISRDEWAAFMVLTAK
ncbi:DUF397 domain-containing protein [Streptomyces sp. NPDC002309]